MYVVGLWKEDMFVCFVWFVMVSGMRFWYGVYIGFSWFWVLMDLYVLFKMEEEDEEGVVFYGIVFKVEVELVMFKVRFVVVKSVLLVIRGRVYWVSLRVDFEIVELDIEGVVLKEKKVNVMVMVVRVYVDKIGVNFDVWEDGWVGDFGFVVVDVLLMLLFEWIVYDLDIGMLNWGGLVVVEIEKGVYCRIGYFEEYFYKRIVGRVMFVDFIVGVELRDVLLV